MENIDDLREAMHKTLFTTDEEALKATIQFALLERVDQFYGMMEYLQEDIRNLDFNLQKLLANPLR